MHLIVRKIRYNVILSMLQIIVACYVKDGTETVNRERDCVNWKEETVVLCGHYKVSHNLIFMSGSQ